MIRSTVTAMALGAMLLTNPAAAGEEAQPAAPSAETPLALRPGKPLDLESSPKSSGAGWKFLVVLAVGGAFAWAWKQRGRQGAKLDTHDLRILKRATLGVRSELVLVELEGQKLLVGVTPSSMQTLYLMPDAHPEAASESPEIDDAPLAHLLSARASRPAANPAPPSRRERAARPAPTEKEEPVYEGQALGLKSIGSRR